MRSDLVNAFERWERPIRNGLTRMKERGELRASADVHELAISFRPSRVVIC